MAAATAILLLRPPARQSSTRQARGHTHVAYLVGNALNFGGRFVNLLLCSFADLELSKATFGLENQLVELVHVCDSKRAFECCTRGIKLSKHLVAAADVQVVVRLERRR